jgi:hypothetical protein
MLILSYFFSALVSSSILFVNKVILASGHNVSAMLNFTFLQSGFMNVSTSPDVFSHDEASLG